jgi:hypothetical protein
MVYEMELSCMTLEGGRSIPPALDVFSQGVRRFKECSKIPLVVQIWVRPDIATKILLTSARQDRTSVWSPDKSSFSYCTDPVSYQLDFSS